MDHSTTDPYKIFDSLRKRVPFKLCIKSITPDEILLRSTVRNMVQATAFIEAYETIINCKFVGVNCRSGRGSSTSMKKWVCTNRQTTKCPGQICILIKKVCKETTKNDAFLRRSLPFRGVIRINPNHNHFIIVAERPPTSSVLQRTRKINNDVKECFYEYFKRGIIGAEAKAIHEYNLQKSNCHYLRDPSMNPNLRTVSLFYDSWLKLKENGWVDTVERAPVSMRAAPVRMLNIESSKTNQSPADQSINLVDMNVLANIKKEPESDSNDENITQDLADVPVVDCKKEVEDDYKLPVISSYGTLKQPLLPSPVIQNVTSMKVMPTQISANDSAEDVSKSALLTLKCKQEIDTDVDDGLPVISSYGSLAKSQLQILLEQNDIRSSKPSFRNITPRLEPCAQIASLSKTSAAKNVASLLKYKPSTSKVVVFDVSSNTYKVANCVSLSTYSPGASAYSSSQYNSHLPGALLSTRVVLPKL